MKVAQPPVTIVTAKTSIKIDTNVLTFIVQTPPFIITWLPNQMQSWCRMYQDILLAVIDLLTDIYANQIAC